MLRLAQEASASGWGVTVIEAITGIGGITTTAVIGAATGMKGGGSERDAEPSLFESGASNVAYDVAGNATAENGGIQR